MNHAGILRLLRGMILVDSTSLDQFRRLAPFLTPSATAQARALFRKPNPEHVDIRRAERPAGVMAPFPRIPLVVLSAPASTASHESFRGHEKEARSVMSEMDLELAALAPNGRLIRVKRTGHFIPLDRPDVVIRSIKSVVNATR